MVAMINKKYGRLTVVERAGSSAHKVALWLCSCECGNKIIAEGRKLRSGNTKSCGCLWREITTKHGLTNHKLYGIHQSILQRCYNENDQAYVNYGRRGIKVCQEWSDSESGFMNFFEWSTNNGYGENLSIDRIDVNGNYEPSNCRWASDKTQANNKRSSVYITIDNETKTMAEWSEFSGISKDLIRKRLNKGFSPDEILAPPMKKEKLSGVKGIYLNKKSNKWDANYTKGYKKVYIGRYETLDEAKKALYDYMTNLNNLSFE